MSNIIYQSTIIKIGEFASDALADAMLIIFKIGAPADLADYCFIHTHDMLSADLACGQTLTLGDTDYTITAVGDVATTNLRELGHITIRFDGNHCAELPGTVHVSGNVPQLITTGDTIMIIAK